MPDIISRNIWIILIILQGDHTVTWFNSLTMTVTTIRSVLTLLSYMYWSPDIFLKFFRGAVWTQMLSKSVAVDIFLPALIKYPEKVHEWAHVRIQWKTFLKPDRRKMKKQTSRLQISRDEQEEPYTYKIQESRAFRDKDWLRCWCAEC